MTMPYTTSKTEAYYKHAEVFTPAGVVFEMLLDSSGIREVVRDVDRTMFDPAVGHGQYPCAELVWKMFYNLDTLDEPTAIRTLASLYGIDIQATSVASCKENLKATIAAAYKFFTGKEFSVPLAVLNEILDENFIVGDSLKIMKDWIEANTPPRQCSLF